MVPVKLVRIEKDRHRLGLSLRQARSDAEAMGFVFTHDGAVIDYPEDVREQFGLPPRDAAAVAASRRGLSRGPPRKRSSAPSQRDPEPVSAFAHAFAQALENAEPGTAFTESETADAAGEPEAEARSRERRLLRRQRRPRWWKMKCIRKPKPWPNPPPATEPAEAKAEANTEAEAPEAVGQLSRPA